MKSFIPIADNSDFTIYNIPYGVFTSDKNGETAVKARAMICDVYGDNCIAERTCRKWFARFRSGNLSLSDEQRPGRPEKLDNDTLRDWVEKNPGLSINAIADKLGSTHSTVYRHLLAIGKVSKSKNVEIEEYAANKNT